MLSAKIVAQNPAGSVSSAVPVVQGAGVAAVVAAVPTVSGRLALESPAPPEQPRRSAANDAADAKEMIRTCTVRSLLEVFERERQEPRPRGSRTLASGTDSGSPTEDLLLRNAAELEARCPLAI